jgi:hypothetical protein
MEYNAPLCEQTFDLLMSVNAFGPRENIPDSLQGKDVQFKFKSPLEEAKDRELTRTFMETKALIAEATQLEPAMAQIMNTQKAFRAAVKGAGAPTEWFKDEAEMDEITAQTAERTAAAKQADFIGQGAAVVEQVGNAAASVQQAAA